MTKETSGSFITAIYTCVMLIGFLLFFRLSYTNITASKYEFFLIATGIYIVLVAISVMFGAEFSIGNASVTDIGMLAFGVAHVLAWCVTEDKGNAFTGENSRHMGLQVYLMYVMLYFCITRFLIFKRNYTYVFALGCCMYYVMSVMQYFKVDFFGTYKEIGEVSSHYFMATVGNVNFCSAFAGSSLGFFSLLYVTCKKNRQRVIYGICCALGMMSLYVFNSDGGYLGMAAVFVLLVLMFATHRTTARRILELLLIYTGGMLILFSLIQILQIEVWMEGISSILNQPAWFAAAFVIFLLGRLVCEMFRSNGNEQYKKILVWTIIGIFVAGVIGAGIVLVFYKDWFLGHSSNNLGVASGRTYIWAYVWDGYKEFPLLNKIFGLGQETMRQYCLTHNTQEYYAKFKSILDAAHCEYLHYLFTTGIAGAVSYLVMLVSFFVSAWKWAKENILLYGVLGFVGVYAVQAAVSIAEPAVTPFLFLMISIGSSIIFRAKLDSRME